MKIIHFIGSIDRKAGGTTSFLQLLTREMHNSTEIVVATGNSISPVELPKVKIHYFNLNLLYCPFVSIKFTRFLRNEQPDLVHINGIWTPHNWLFQKSAQRLGIKVLLSPHGMLEPYILKRHPLKKKLAMLLYQNRTIRKADFLLATAQSELDQFRKLGYQQPASVIPNGIDLSEVKQKMNWDKGPITNFLFLSRIHPKKGIELLIDAVAQLKSTNLKVTIAGEGDKEYIELLKKKAVQKGVSSLFDFVGGVYGNQKWELLQKADLFVLPTYSENFGIVIAEALATGIPVITTKGTPWEELETHHCGWWIELNVTTLSASLTKALNTSSEDLHKIGLRGIKLVERKYDIKAVAKEMTQLYQCIASCKKQVLEVATL